MGIYISDMEMPKERESFTITIKYNGLVFDTETGIQIAEAYELPPHGRMVDLDKILKDLYTNYRYALTRSVLDRLEASQIIIPADPVEED